MKTVLKEKLLHYADILPGEGGGVIKKIAYLLEKGEIVLSKTAEQELKELLFPKVYSDPLESAMQNPEFCFTKGTVTLFGKDWTSDSREEKKRQMYGLSKRNGFQFTLHYFSDYKSLKDFLNQNDAGYLFYEKCYEKAEGEK